MNNNTPVSWQDSLSITYHEFTSQFISFAPQLIGALALLLFGWIVALSLRTITKRLVRGLDSLFKRASKTEGLRHETIKRSYAEIVSKLVFWTVMVFFIAAATNMLGWNMFSNWMSNIITYLPNLIAGLLIILAGFLVSNIARTSIANTTASAGIKQGEMLARIAQAIVLFTALVVGIEQIGINVNFLTHVLIVVIGVLLAGATLAFSLGAKTLVANVVGAQYVRKHCRIGEVMQIGEYEGSVVEVTQTSIILDNGSGRTVVPAKYFQEQIVSFSSTTKSTKEHEPQSPETGDK